MKVPLGWFLLACLAGSCHGRSTEVSERKEQWVLDFIRDMLEGQTGGSTVSGSYHVVHHNHGGSGGLGSGTTSGQGASMSWVDLDPNLKDEYCRPVPTRDSTYIRGSGSKAPNNRGCGGYSAKFRLMKLVKEIKGFMNPEPTSDLIEGKIVGGQEAKVGEFPFLVAIGRKNFRQECGGSLIASDWVLTAAHCFDSYVKPCEYIVRVGEHDLESSVEKHEDIVVSKIFTHKDFRDSRTLPNDIALVKLSKSAGVSKKEINTVCLPPAGYEVRVGTSCVVAGWGDKTNGGKQYATKIQYIKLPVLDTRNGCGNNRGVDPKIQLCAGHLQGGKDSCQGDSGGPLFCRMGTSGPYYQVGVVSYGKDCAERNWPGVYAKVSNYIPWINDVIRRYG